MVCTHCGNENPKQANFCAVCGSPLPPVVGRISRQIGTEIETAARSDAKILITGEGASLVARLIHDLSGRRQAAFIAISCGKVSESELFGHLDEPGKLQLAHDGTLFLDEVGQMSLRMQMRLLRALDTGEIRKVGADSECGVNVRMISGTSTDPGDLIARGTFREDLYWRLNVIHVHVPPPRE